MKAKLGQKLEEAMVQYINKYGLMKFQNDYNEIFKAKEIEAGKIRKIKVTERAVNGIPLNTFEGNQLYFAIAGIWEDLPELE